jgi:hypothetical protein
MIAPTNEEIRNKAHYLYDKNHNIWWIHDPEEDAFLKRGNFWQKAQEQFETENPEEWVARLEKNIKAINELVEKHGPTERVYHHGTRRFYGDEEWEKFVQSHLWAGRVEPKLDKVETIDWLEEREKLERRLEEIKKLPKAPEAGEDGSPAYMPNRREILDKALELFFKENPEAPTPEEEELKEGNYWLRARDKLLMTRAIPLSEWERYKAEVKSLAEELDIVEEAAEERISRERERWEAEIQKLREEIQKLKLPPGLPIEELPEEIRGYVRLLHVNVTAKPEKKLLPGFKESTWAIPVHDEETCDTVAIVHGHPYTELEKYQLMKITNKRGAVLTVLVLKEEYEKLAVPTPTEPEIEKAVKKAEEAIPEVKVTAPLDWKWILSIAQRVQQWLKAAERQAEKRNSVAVYTHVTSIIEWLEDVKERLLAKTETLRMHEARRLEPVIKILRDYEYEQLWKEFSKELSEERIDPTPYRPRFDDLIAWNMPLQDNRAIVMDEAKGIILEKSMEKYIKKLPLKPARFSWKWVSWGLASLRVDAGALKEAAKRENVVQAYSTTTKMIETADKLRKLVEMSPDVIDFKELRKKSSD